MLEMRLARLSIAQSNLSGIILQLPRYLPRLGLAGRTHEVSLLSGLIDEEALIPPA